MGRNDCPVDSVDAISYTQPMKRLLILAVLCAVPVTAFSHPGKTDLYGGHKCLKDCEEWGLFYAEYHLHDKDGRSVRLGRKKRTPEVSRPKIRTAATTTVLPAPLVTSQTVTVYRHVTSVLSEDILSSNPLLFVLLILLLLLLILRLNRRREEN